MAIAIFVMGAKGHSALQLSRDLDVQYKTAFVLAHKLREAMASETADETLQGDVEVDGAYFGGHVRPANWKENRVDRRLAQHQTGKRRVVVVMRERNGMTLPFVFQGAFGRNQQVRDHATLIRANSPQDWWGNHPTTRHGRLHQRHGYVQSR